MESSGGLLSLILSLTLYFSLSLSAQEIILFVDVLPLSLILSFLFPLSLSALSLTLFVFLAGWWDPFLARVLLRLVSL